VKPGHTAKKIGLMLPMPPETARAELHWYNDHGRAGWSPNYTGKISALLPKHREELRATIGEWEAPEPGGSVLQGREIQEGIQQN